ncbi:MAG: T9SS type A sorting domain-containing protein [Lewinellaceae bacterium]|nr:T9SS type A sorting domain-containing protein [Lewinellaceae bacterium]
MKKYYLLSFFLIFSNLSTYAQKIIFVNQNVAGGLQNGEDWGNAFHDLQQGLAAAVYGDAIWVAAGTYYPTATTDRTISFVLKQGVKLYGGFNGTEINWSQRDYSLNETILSGNIGSPLGSDNSYHVLFGSGLDSTATLDGFIVTRGGATSAPLPVVNSRGGGLYLEPSPTLYNSNPQILNCRFELNHASSGGAIYCVYGFANVVNPVFRNCRFINNRASTFAGALYKGGPAAPGTPSVMEDCIFQGNAALTSDAGAIYVTNAGNTFIYRRCIFEKDSAWAGLGGGLHFGGFDSGADSARLVLDSCIFRENYASEGAGITYVNYADSDIPFTCDISGCTFEQNKTRNGDGAALFFLGLLNSRMKVNISNTLFENNLTLTYATNKIDSGKNSDLEINMKGCKYLNNRNAVNENATNFALLGGVGGIAGQGSTCRIAIDNCLFANNGGGLGLLSSPFAKARSTITNCTFYRNNEFVIDKTWYPGFDTTDNYGNDCYITNCLFWEPGSAANQMFTNNDFTNVNMLNYYIDYSMINLPGINIPGAAGAFGSNVYFGTYPMFSDTTAGDFRLLSCSPAVNRGDNVAADTIGLTTDLDGLPRFFGNIVDLGAYEVQDTCLIIGSTEPVNTPKIVISPNPAPSGGFLSIESTTLKDIIPVNWSISDVSGKIISHGDVGFEGSIPAPAVPGIYFLQINGDFSPTVLRFIVF